MEFQHFNVKFYLKNPEDLDPHLLNPVFQTWIRDKVTPELLIDVADYLHVPEGPGMVLVGLECDFALDHTGGIWGLKYNRKDPQEGQDSDRLKHALKTTLEGCLRLEQEKSLAKKLSFTTESFEIFVNDRAIAPNTPKTLEAFTPVLTKVLNQLTGQQDCTWEPPTDSRERFGVVVQCPGKHSVESFLKNLA